MKINKTSDYIKKHGRLLDYYLILSLENDFYYNEVVIELRKFQNSDGGFGNGLEPDFFMKESSVLATTIAMKILNNIEHIEKEEIIKKAINYFEKTFQNDAKLWVNVSKVVNNYPHAPWWEYSIDAWYNFSKLNPTIEVIGYLYKYRKYLKILNIDEIMNIAQKYINEVFSVSDNQHDLKCILVFYNCLPDNLKIIYKELIIKKIYEIVDLRGENWEEYNMQPIEIIHSKEDDFYKEFESYIKKNLSYHEKNMKKDNIIYPRWTWGYDLENWEIAKNNWSGYLTYLFLKMKKYID